MGSTPKVFLIIVILNQNFNNIYFTFNKTRRYKTYVKYNYTPFLFLRLLLLSLSGIENSVYVGKLKDLYHNKSVWYFYNSNIFWKKALLTNNLNQSYDYWLLKDQVTLFNCLQMKDKLSKLSPVTNYVKPVKIFNFFFKKKKLSLMFLIIFLSVFKQNFDYKNINNLKSACFVLPNTLNLFVFNNYYYFKIHNY